MTRKVVIQIEAPEVYDDSRDRDIGPHRGRLVGEFAYIWRWFIGR
jgi:hypothetical protein